MRARVAQCFDRGQVIFGDGLHAGVAGRERGALRDDDEVVRAAIGAQEATRVADVHTHAWIVVEVADECGARSARDVHDACVAFDHVHAPRLGGQRMRDVDACTNHQHAIAGTDRIRQRRCRAVQVGQAPWIAAIDEHTRRIAVDVNAELRRRFVEACQAQARRMAQRHARGFEHRQPTLRAFARGDDAGIAHEQGFRQSFVFIDRRRWQDERRNAREREDRHARERCASRRHQDRRRTRTERGHADGGARDRQDFQQREGRNRAGARAEEIGAIQTRDPGPVTRERQPEATRREEERYRQA